MNLPDCTKETSILETELAEVAQRGKVQRIRLTYTPKGSYLAIVLKDDPNRVRLLTTRRERTRPKLFIDQNLLFAHLYESFPAIEFTGRVGHEAMGEPSTAAAENAS